MPRERLPDFDVVSVKCIHDGVIRIRAADASEIDVPTVCTEHVDPGDRFLVEIGSSDEAFDDAVFLMQGVVYAKSGTFTFVSCGGLLAKIVSASSNISDTIRLAITKNRRRRRESSAPPRRTSSRT